jgi:hypothetical protein
MNIVSDSERYGFQMNVSFTLTVTVQEDTDQRQLMAQSSPSGLTLDRPVLGSYLPEKL